MESVITIFTALIFYGLGRFSGREGEVYEKVRREIKKRVSPSIVGPVNYPTQDALDYMGSEEERIDQDMIKKAKEAGLEV